jgi:hypothetical protein
MAVDTTKGTNVAAPAAAPVQAGVQELAPVLLGKKKKKKKKKESFGLRDAQDFQRAFSKASRRVARGLADGFATYDKRTRKSSRKKRDGAIRDAVENAARGLGKAGRVASWAPVDLIKGANTKTVRRAVRNTIRFFTAPFPFFR